MTQTLTNFPIRLDDLVFGGVVVGSAAFIYLLGLTGYLAYQYYYNSPFTPGSPSIDPNNSLTEHGNDSTSTISSTSTVRLEHGNESTISSTETIRPSTNHWGNVSQEIEQMNNVIKEIETKDNLIKEIEIAEEVEIIDSPTSQTDSTSIDPNTSLTEHGNESTITLRPDNDLSNVTPEIETLTSHTPEIGRAYNLNEELENIDQCINSLGKADQILDEVNLRIKEVIAERKGSIEIITKDLGISDSTVSPFNPNTPISITPENLILLNSDVSIDHVPNVNDLGIQVKAITTDFSSQTEPNLTSTSVDAVPSIADIGVQSMQNVSSTSVDAVPKTVVNSIQTDTSTSVNSSTMTNQTIVNSVETQTDQTIVNSVETQTDLFFDVDPSIPDLFLEILQEMII